MAKVIVRDLTSDIRFATVKAVFDEVAEDCSILSVSDDGNYKLILTVDTDLVLSIQLAEATGNISTRLIEFNGNTIGSSTSSSTQNAIRIIIAYTDTFFLVWIKQYASSNNLFFSYYDKLGSGKFAYGYANTSTPSITNVYDMDNRQYSRLTAALGSGYTLPTKYIDYMDSTIIYGNGIRAPEIDTNFLYVLSPTSIAPHTIVTMDNKDYYAITNQYLIPIDDE